MSSKESNTKLRRRKKKVLMPKRDDIIKITCAGCHRSGSTWLFNAARLIMQSTGQEVYSCFVTDYDPEHSAPVHVVKCHNRHRILLDSHYFFTTKRDPRDIAASAVRRNLIEEKDAIKYLKRVISKEYERWRHYTNLEIQYEDLIGNKDVYIRRISKILKVKVKPGTIRKRIESLPIPEGEKERDPVTLLHGNHITDGKLGSYKRTLSATTQTEICAVFYNWMKRHGYL